MEKELSFLYSSFLSKISSLPYNKEIKEALEFAEKAHKGQKRKNGVPYIIHPIRVAYRILNHGIKDKEIIVSALLHDVVEDTPITLEEIEEQFGKEVKEIVDALSKRKGETKKEYIERVKLNEKAKFIKAYDSFDNLMDLEGLKGKLSNEWIEKNKEYWKKIVLDFGNEKLKEELSSYLKKQ